MAVPTLGQAVWCMGFSESYANDSCLTIYSHYFGYPSSAAISLGLPVAYPASLLIKAGMYAADAYSIMAAFWLSLAFLGAFLFSKLFGSKTVFSILTSVLWMSLPIIWAHANYSAISFGIALIPLYLFLACRIFALPEKSGVPRFRYYAAYICICIISLFMDGYTFVMFAVAASFIGAYAFIRFNGLRRYLITRALPIHILGFGLAVFFYMAYIGGSLYNPAPLDFFRGWGLDLSFVAIPTQGIHWLWDSVGLSLPRSSEQFFGDASVWQTTFLLPLVITGLLCWWWTKSSNKLTHAFFILAILSLYLAMGPSIKIASTKLEPMGPLMPAELAIAPTGNAFLFSYVPGFNIMRAVYRWSTLMAFSFWALVVLKISTLRVRRSELIMTLVLIILVISSVPHLHDKWVSYTHDRESFYEIDTDLVTVMDQDLEKDELIAFLPYRNDFLVNYLAPKLVIRTYNIGGDKNLATAKEYWPETMQQFRMGLVDCGFVDRVLLLLARGEANAVVLPYIDMLWAAHDWPAPTKFKEELEPIIDDLLNSGFVTVQERQYYAVVRIIPGFVDQIRSGTLEKLVTEERGIDSQNLIIRGWQLETLPKQVGYYEDETLHSDERSGFLVYGPYAPLDAGEYYLTVTGIATSVSSAWVDVMSEHGTTEHAKFTLSQTEDGETVVIASGLVRLDEPVKDLEVRVYVGTDDNVRLNGYELKPVDNTTNSLEKN